jgi:tail protein X
MRIFITDKESDLPAIAAGLARSARATDATLERVLALNPQIADTARVPAGSVLVLPDADVRAGAGAVVGGSTLGELGETVGAGLRAATTRVTERLEALTRDHAAVRDALKTAAAKRVIEGDPLLAQRLEASEARFKADQKEATESKARFSEIQKAALGEFARLEKLLG